MPQSGKNIWKMKFFPGQGKVIMPLAEFIPATTRTVRDATVGGKYLVREKSGNLVCGQGNLERTWKVREKSGNLKINGYSRQFQKIYLFCSRGERMYILMR